VRALADPRRFVLAVLVFLGSALVLSGCAMHRPGTELRTVAYTGEVQEYDPWEPFNVNMFEFNRDVDRWVVKPAARGWRAVLPEFVRDSFQHALRNLGFPRRFVNNMLQLKVEDAGRELAGFLVNSTVGLGGFMDVAQQSGVLPKRDEDTGQTLAVWGVGPGPYLVLPFFPPSTVRDSVASVVDMLLDPTTFLVPFAGNLAKRAGNAVNERSATLEVYESVEKDVLDLYSAARNAHLQRRERDIAE